MYLAVVAMEKQKVKMKMSKSSRRKESLLKLGSDLKFYSPWRQAPERPVDSSAVDDCASLMYWLQLARLHLHFGLRASKPLPMAARVCPTPETRELTVPPVAVSRMESMFFSGIEPSMRELVAFKMSSPLISTLLAWKANKEVSGV